MTVLTALDRLLDRELNPDTPRQWDTPGALAVALDPAVRDAHGRVKGGTVQTPALRLIDRELTHAAETPDSRLIISMPPQEGKSQRGSFRFPEWVLHQHPDKRVAIVSYEHNMARRFGRMIRDDLIQHEDVLALSVRADVSAQNEWELTTGGGVYTTGIGGPLTGRRVDLLIIDDPVKDPAQANSKTYRDRAWDWFTDVALTRLAPGAPVILIMTRWHHDDLAGRILASEEGHRWRVVNIPAQAESVNDPLGRQPGEYLESSRGRTVEQWERRKAEVGSRVWTSLYQGSPTPDTGSIFDSSWWGEWPAQPWLERDDGARIITATAGVELVQSWDMAFKATDHSDYVVGQVWMRRGPHAWLLDQVRGRWDFPETVRQVRSLSARWPQAVAKLVEDKANGPAVIAFLQNQLGGFIPVEPMGSKTSRAEAVTPVIEAGQVLLPPVEQAPWVAGLMEECKAFPSGVHDDQVDALTQAVHRLLIIPALQGRTFTTEDVLGDDDALALDWADTTY